MSCSVASWWCVSFSAAAWWHGSCSVAAWWCVGYSAAAWWCVGVLVQWCTSFTLTWPSLARKLVVQDPGAASGCCSGSKHSAEERFLCGTHYLQSAIFSNTSNTLRYGFNPPSEAGLTQLRFACERVELEFNPLLWCPWLTPLTWTILKWVELGLDPLCPFYMRQQTVLKPVR